MHIANPMYDSVFKFLMEDNALAKLLIGTIIQADILSLDFRPQERTSEIEDGSSRCLTVYRMDFAARIRDAQGEERQVLIELQKAKYATDIMRFRRYLGSQYRDPDNTRLVETGHKQSQVVRQGPPLLTIYFLGHRLEHSKAPVIRVRRRIEDLATGEALAEKEPFIESLTHDSYVIQVPQLRGQRRNEIEAMLQLFDPGRESDNRHFLEIDETEIPTAYRGLLRRLQMALAEPKIAEAMEIEDEILEALRENERALAKLRQWAEAADQRAEAADQRAAEEKQRAAAEKQRAEAADQRAAAEKQRAEQAQASMELERQRAAKLAARLRALGMDPEGGI